MRTETYSRERRRGYAGCETCLVWATMALAVGLVAGSLLVRMA